MKAEISRVSFKIESIGEFKLFLCAGKWEMTEFVAACNEKLPAKFIEGLGHSELLKYRTDAPEELMALIQYVIEEQTEELIENLKRFIANEQVS